MDPEILQVTHKFLLDIEQVRHAVLHGTHVVPPWAEYPSIQVAAQVLVWR